MSILFLDIDGVLNGHQKTGRIDQHCMANLNYVIEQTGCVIVISSSWRYMIPEAMNIQGFEYMLVTHGFKGKVKGITVRDEVICKREDQILDYAKQRNMQWAVVDDLPLQIDNFVRTDGQLGLQHHDAIKLIQILTRKNMDRELLRDETYRKLIARSDAIKAGKAD